MGCDFFYSGTLPDVKAQEEVISLASSFYDTISLKILPAPETRYPTYFITYDMDRLTKEYPFNFFGIAPFFKDKIFEQGQFIFDRSDNGRLVRLPKIPDHFNLPPFEEHLMEIDEQNEGVMTNKDHRNTGIEKRTYRIMLATAILMAALITSGCVTTGDSVGSSSRFRHGHHHAYSHAPNHRGAHWKSPNHRNGQRGPGQHHSRSFSSSGSGRRR